MSDTHDQQETMPVFTIQGWADRWLSYQGGIVRGRAAVCYRNGDTERTIYGPSLREGWLALPRVWWWAHRRFSGLPVRKEHPEAQP